MNDRVSEVVLERELLGGRDWSGLILSGLLHGGAAILALSALGRAATEPKRYVNIRLAAPRISPMAPVTKTIPAKLKQAPAPAPVSSTPPSAIEKRSPTAPTQKSVFGRSEKKLAASRGAQVTERDDEPAQLQPEAVLPVPAVGAAGVTGLDTSFPYTVYIERMITLVGKNWFRPQVRGELLVTLYFVIERDGRIRDVKVEKESGNALFDRAAYRAALESSPLPPLPFGYGGTFLGVHLTFR